ncbi:MAG: metallophosphoesterase [Syntrophales bacterium]|nr:metallophosphoesterase [Syntrophales bacterium]
MQQKNDDILIYAVADIHGSFDRLRKVKALLEREGPHGMVLAGDLLGHPEDESTVAFLDDLAVSGFVVPGNMDAPTLKRQVEQARSLRWIVSRPQVFYGVIILGLGVERNVIEVDEFYRKEDGNWILVTHRPPWGVQDRDFFGRHAGSKDVADIAKRLKPMVVICGHIHEDAGWSYLDDIPVVNCSLGAGGAGSLIEIKEGRVSNIRMMD